jgi:hypothetical protein
MRPIRLDVGTCEYTILETVHIVYSFHYRVATADGFRYCKVQGECLTQLGPISINSRVSSSRRPPSSHPGLLQSDEAAMEEMIREKSPYHRQNVKQAK